MFRPICRNYNVRLEATRGDWSDSEVYEAAKRLRPLVARGQDVRILYFGDFNPSGFHAPVAIQQKLNAYGLALGRATDIGCENWRYFDSWPFEGPVEFDTDATFAFERVALNTEHVDRFDLPENPTPSNTDKDRKIRDRFMDFVTGGRDVNIELDALKEFECAYLEDLIEESIRANIDLAAKKEADERLMERREEIRDAVADMQDARGDDDDENED